MHAKTVQWARVSRARCSGGWFLLGWLALLPAAGAAETGPGPAPPAVQPSVPKARAVLVSIDNVDSLETFLRADQALEALAGVTDRELLEVAPQRLLYRLQVRGGLRTLRAGLSRDGALQALSPAPVPAAKEAQPDIQLRMRP